MNLTVDKIWVTADSAHGDTVCVWTRGVPRFDGTVWHHGYESKLAGASYTYGTHPDRDGVLPFLGGNCLFKPAPGSGYMAQRDKDEDGWYYLYMGHLPTKRPCVDLTEVDPPLDLSEGRTFYDIPNVNPNTTHLTTRDISHEEYREYSFEGCHNYRIDDPVTLYTRPGGTTHCVLDDQGIVHCVPAPGHCGCVLRWFNGRDADGQLNPPCRF